jgi:hypothetical protein
MPFNDPASMTGLPLNDLLGALLLIDVHEQMPEMSTTYGPATPIRADVMILDGPHKSAEYPDTLIFPKVLIGQLRGSIGSKVIGRLTRGQAKLGQSAPWKLEAATPEDKAIGERYLQYATAKAVDEEPF